MNRITGILIFIVLSFTVFYTTDGNAYKEVYFDFEVENVKNHYKKKLLRVFNSPDKKKYKEYYLVRDNYKITIGDQKIWGFCITEPIKVNKVLINGELLKLKKIKENDCDSISVIKEYNGLIEKKEVFYARLLISLIISFLILEYLKLLNKLYLVRTRLLYSRTNKLLAINLSISLIILISWLYLVFPTIVDDDFIRTTKNLTAYRVNDWFSYLNDLTLLGASRLWNSVRFFSFMSLSTCFLLITYMLLSIKKSKLNNNWMFFISLFLLFPSFGNLFNYITRDLIVIYGNIFLAFYIIFNFNIKGYRVEGLLKNSDFVAILIAASLSELRREEILVAIFFLIIFSYLAKLDLRKKSIVLLFFLSLKIFGGLIKDTIVFDSLTNRKIIVTLSHYIGSVITDKDGVYTEDDEKVLSKYFRLDLIRKFHTQNSAEPTFFGAIVENNVKTSIEDIYPTMFNLIRNNLWLSLKARFKLMFYTLGPSSLTIHSPPPFTRSWHVGHWKEIVNSGNMNYLNEFELIKIQSLGRKILLESRAGWLKYFFFNGTLALLFLTLVIVFYRKLGILSLASLIIFSRVPVFFILTPAGQFKYLADIYFYSVLLIPFVIYQISLKDYKFNLKERPKPSF